MPESVFVVEGLHSVFTNEMVSPGLKQPVGSIGTVLAVASATTSTFPTSMAGLQKHLEAGFGIVAPIQVAWPVEPSMVWSQGRIWLPGVCHVIQPSIMSKPFVLALQMISTLKVKNRDPPNPAQEVSLAVKGW